MINLRNEFNAALNRDGLSEDKYRRIFGGSCFINDVTLRDGGLAISGYRESKIIFEIIGFLKSNVNSTSNINSIQ
jgi:hypothetical protein